MRQEISYGIVPVLMDQGVPQFLLLHQRTGNWSFPKGHIEQGETPVETARRELLEECGISSIRLLTDCTFKESYVFLRDGVPTEKQNEFFLGLLSGKKIQIQEKEIQAYRFISIKDIEALPLFDNTKRILREAEQVLKNIV